MAEQEHLDEVLDATARAVREHPGLAAVNYSLLVYKILLVPGEEPPPLLPRPKMLAVLGELEKRGTVTRRRGQAVVTFHPAQEG